MRIPTRLYHLTKYPRCWKRASLAIRRLAGNQCEQCGQACQNLSVHHIGAPYADGSPGDHCDKHDIRRENLIALCFPCHDGLEQIGAIARTRQKRRQRRTARREAHQALGLGTGLVIYQGE